MILVLLMMINFECDHFYLKFLIHEKIFSFIKFNLSFFFILKSNSIIIFKIKFRLKIKEKTQKTLSKSRNRLKSFL